MLVERNKEFIANFTDSGYPLATREHLNYEDGAVSLGWEPLPEDLIFKLHQHAPSPAVFRDLVQFARLAGREPFFEVRAYPRGGFEIGPYIVQFLAEFALGKGIEKALEFLRSPEAQKLARAVSIAWSDTPHSGKINLIVHDPELIKQVTFVFPGYPDCMKDVTPSLAQKLISTYQKDLRKQAFYLYDPKGRRLLEADASATSEFSA